MFIFHTDALNLCKLLQQHLMCNFVQFTWLSRKGVPSWNSDLLMQKMAAATVPKQQGKIRKLKKACGRFCFWLPTAPVHDKNKPNWTNWIQCHWNIKGTSGNCQNAFPAWFSGYKQLPWLTRMCCWFRSHVACCGLSDIRNIPRSLYHFLCFCHHCSVPCCGKGYFWSKSGSHEIDLKTHSMLTSISCVDIKCAVQWHKFVNLQTCTVWPGFPHPLFILATLLCSACPCKSACVHNPAANIVGPSVVVSLGKNYTSRFWTWPWKEQMKNTKPVYVSKKPHFRRRMCLFLCLFNSSKELHVLLFSCLLKKQARGVNILTRITTCREPASLTETGGREGRKAQSSMM